MNERVIMDLDSIKMTEAAFDDICAILNASIGDIRAKDLNDESLSRLIAAVMDVAYKIGYRDASK